MTVVHVPTSPVMPAGNTDADAAEALSLNWGHVLRFQLDPKQWMAFNADRGAWEPFYEAQMKTLCKLLGKTQDRQYRATISAAQAEQELHVSVHAFDKHPYLFNTKNGTLNLRPLPEDLEIEPGVFLTFPPDWCWEFKPHDPADLLTQVAGTLYDPEARCPRWDQFLERVQPNPEVREWLQRLIGYALVGRQTEHIFTVLYGKGANGKSTFVDVLGRLFGDYDTVAEKTLFKQVLNDAHPADRADLINKRLARSEELPDVELDEPKIKGLTGGDTIKGRGMRENFKQWDPTHTFLVHSNTKPRLSGTDDGIWRRVALVPFAVKIPESEADPYLKDKLYYELPGILNWALRGYEAFCEQGLFPLPEVLRAAVSDYRAESDTVSMFVERYELSPGDKVFGMIQDHKEYAAENGMTHDEARRNYRAVCNALGEMGAQSKKAHNPAKGRTDSCWLGLRPRQ